MLGVMIDRDNDGWVPRALSIAGSDSGGGAGIQADLKAFARCGVHGMTAVTAVTVQNTTEVRAVYPLPPHVIVEQVAAVMDDIGVDAVKIGMLGNVATIEAVAAALDLTGNAPVVLDPVMVAETGTRLLDEDAREALIELLVPRVTVITPNVPEARALSGEGEELDARGFGARDPRSGPPQRGGHGRSSRRGDRSLLRRPRTGGDSRRTAPRRRGPRIGLHALLGAGGASGARPRSAGGRAAREGGRIGGRCRGVEDSRRGRGTGRPVRHCGSRRGERLKLPPIALGHSSRRSAALWHNRRPLRSLVPRGDGEWQRRPGSSSFV